MSAIALQKIVDRQTMLTIVEHRENRNSPPIIAYDPDIGTKVQNALDYEGVIQSQHVKPYYTNAVNVLRDAGLLKFEVRGGAAYMSPTYAGYQWFEREIPGKYLEIVRKLIADEMTEKNARDCERRRRCSSV